MYSNYKPTNPPKKTTVLSDFKSTTLHFFPFPPLLPLVPGAPLTRRLQLDARPGRVGKFGESNLQQQNLGKTWLFHKNYQEFLSTNIIYVFITYIHMKESSDGVNKYQWMFSNAFLSKLQKCVFVIHIIFCMFS